MSLYVLEGLRPWVIQRVSAVYIVFFILYAVISFLTADTVSFQSWRLWLFQPLNTTVVGVFVIALLFHAWIGMRDVVLDYVHNIMLRIFILGLFIGVLLGSGLWVFRILLLSATGLVSQ
ncbi:MAG: succinate dehydrogenase, hydrophobic membrane anchor protein [Proteobacteria bacterium]|nr:succinate dehydrogenase, hydrophobic membrane anchor protein [Pseudomonadota bacterium]